MRIVRVSAPCRAYSCRYSAARIPNGVTITDIRITISTVPKIAGKIPPSVFDSRGSVETNSTSLAPRNRSLPVKLMPLGR
jgi:hypothetical protein